jgi:transcription initiation factor TFIIH subunit 3
MDSASHLSIIIDFSPQQWHLSASKSTSTNAQTPFSLDDFLPQLFVLINAHLASQHENTLTVIGAFPGKRLCWLMAATCLVLWAHPSLTGV